MKKLTDLFHVEQKKKYRNYGEPTATDILCAIIGFAGFACLLFLLLSGPG